MKTTISILICKTVSFICKLFKKNGTVYPGYIVSKFNGDVLEKIKFPNKVVVVTGSSGKGSTTSLLAHILKTSGKKIIWNEGESNVKNALLTTILTNSKIFRHEVDCDILLIEADERYLPKTFNKGMITDLIITNITRDQPTRNIHPDIIYDSIMGVVDKNIHLYINADDPILSKIKLSHKGKITTYGIGYNNYSKNIQPEYPLDVCYCPNCKSKIEYSLYHYGNFGLFNCPNCEFGRGNVDYEATDVDLSSGTFKLDDTTYKLNHKVFYAVYYTLGALSFALENNINKKYLDKAINKNLLHTHRFETYDLCGKNIVMIDSKNENAPSFIQSLEFILRQPGTKSLIMGFDKVSRRYDLNDLSWLWDIPFELLKDESIKEIFCIGKFKYDVAVRLSHANIDESKIIIIEKLENLGEKILNSTSSTIYTTLYYDLAGKVLNSIKEKNEEYENEKKNN